MKPGVLIKIQNCLIILRGYENNKRKHFFTPSLTNIDIVIPRILNAAETKRAALSHNTNHLNKYDYKQGQL